MAGGKGKRFGAAGKNKTAEEFLGKPLVRYGTDLFSKTMDRVIVVVGVESASVKEAVGENEKVEYAVQDSPKGTGDALKTAIQKIEELGWPVETLFVGNGDHMMFYDEMVIQKMMQELSSPEVSMVMISTIVNEPNKLAWGRVIHNKNGTVERIVEQKDATEKEKAISEQNVNFFAYKYSFARKFCYQIQPSPVSGEYYITDMVQLATQAGGKVTAVVLPFEKVGFGANTKQELEENQRLLAIHTPDLH